MERKPISRNESVDRNYRVRCVSTPDDQPVVQGLAITPSQIEQMARNGIPVSLPNADSFFYDTSVGNEVPPELKVDADRNTLWEMSKMARARILKARKREHESLH